jgi:pimeloyl-ACP methyl ester carboxylesterase
MATFTSLNDAFRSSARQFAPGWMITQAMIASAVEEAGKIGRFQASQASPLLAITRTQARVLLIHGTEDRKPPCSFSQALYAAAKDRSQLILVQGADHDSIMRETTRSLQGPILADDTTRRF